MKSMQDKYQQDPRYRQCVQMMTAMIVDNQFTPSEMREMAVAASIKYEMMRLPRYQVYLDPETENAFKTLRDIESREQVD